MTFLPYLLSRLDGYQAWSRTPSVLQLALFNCREYISLVLNVEIYTGRCASSNLCTDLAEFFTAASQVCIRERSLTKFGNIHFLNKSIR